MMTIYYQKKGEEDEEQKKEKENLRNKQKMEKIMDDLEVDQMLWDQQQYVVARTSGRAGVQNFNRVKNNYYAPIPINKKYRKNK